MLDSVEGCQVCDEHPIERQAQQKKGYRPAEDGGHERDEGGPDEATITRRRRARTCRRLSSSGSIDSERSEASMARRRSKDLVDVSGAS